VARSPDDCPELVATLVAECLSSDPRQRPTAKDVAVRLRTIVGQGRMREHLSGGSFHDHSGLTTPSSGLSLKNFSGNCMARTQCSVVSARPSLSKISANLVYNTTLDRTPGEEEFSVPVPSISPFSVLASKALSTSTCPSGDLTAADFPSSDGTRRLSLANDTAQEGVNLAEGTTEITENVTPSAENLPGSWIMEGS
jgi:hypothetical protein